MIRRPADRRGSAVVELAVTVPVIALVVLGSVEISDAIFTSQALRVTAHECGRVASIMGTDNTDLDALAATILAQRGIVGGRVETTPINVLGAIPGERITVTVIAPFGQNNYISGWVYGQSEMQQSVLVVRGN